MNCSIVFRADANIAIGSGHLMRCLTLARELFNFGNNIIFITQKDSLSFLPVEFPKNYIHHELCCDFDKENSVLQNLLENDCDWLIIDHYELDEVYEKACQSWARNIMCIDDLANRKHCCDILLDQTLGRTKEEYAHLVNQSCRLLVGVEYALVRNDFITLRKKTVKNRDNISQVKNILVSVGATDPKGIILLILNAIDNAKLDCKITVVLSASAPFLAEVRSIAEIMSQDINVICNVDNMAEIMTESDLAIGAAGTSSWERCVLGLPTLLLVVADNQTKIANELNNIGAAVLVGLAENVTVQELSNQIEYVVNSPDLLIKMSKNASSICDGQGASRISQLLHC